MSKKATKATARGSSLAPSKISSGWPTNENSHLSFYTHLHTWEDPRLLLNSPVNSFTIYISASKAQAISFTKHHLAGFALGTWMSSVIRWPRSLFAFHPKNVYDTEHQSLCSLPLFGIPTHCHSLWSRLGQQHPCDWTQWQSTYLSATIGYHFLEGVFTRSKHSVLGTISLGPKPHALGFAKMWVSAEENIGFCY